MKSNDYPVRLKAQPLPLFETPIGFGELQNAEALMNDLATAIRRQKSVDPGLKRSNEGGWHSTTDMLDWGGAAARKLADTAISVAKRMSYFEGATVEDFDWQASMWANVTLPEGSNALHAHPGNLWAAVLYLDMGEDKGVEGCGGNFYIEDPRFPLAAMHNTGFRLLGGDGRPQAYQVELKLQRGNLIVFPAWLRHGVRPYTGCRERVTIAMNIDALARR
jgi:uncharacterized protein (TIGR02466 family)